MLSILERNTSQPSGTATTSSGTATLNKLSGVVTTDNLVGILANTPTEITLVNSFIKSTSIITFSTEDRNLDIPSLSNLSIKYNTLTDGEVKFNYVCTQDIQFEIKIHFTIINP